MSLSLIAFEASAASPELLRQTSLVALRIAVMTSASWTFVMVLQPPRRCQSPHARDWRCRSRHVNAVGALPWRRVPRPWTWPLQRAILTKY